MTQKLLTTILSLILIATTLATATHPATANWTQTQKITSSDGTTGDSFGASVSMDGTTALIGSWGDDNYAGSAYVFTNDGTTWTQQAKLTATDAQPNDMFGSPVCLQGDTAIIGSSDGGPGAAYVFVRNGDQWTQQAKLIPNDSGPFDYFANSISLQGDTVIIGDQTQTQNLGSAYIFTRTGSTWTQQAKLTATDGAPSDNFGASVHLDNTTAIIGAYGVNNFAGAAYIFTQSGSTWTQTAKITDPDGIPGDNFGNMVTLHADTALIAASGQNNLTGSVYVYHNDAGQWTQEAQLTASDGQPNDLFGASLTLDANTALIGASGINTMTGAAYVFTRSGTTWTQEAKLAATGGQSLDFFGLSVALKDTTALIGAYGDSGFVGAAYIFTRNQNQAPTAEFTWTPTRPLQGQTVTFDATASSDPDGTISLYEWDWNNDGTYEESHTTPTATHSWPDPGTYDVTLKVTDNEGASATVTQTLTIDPSNLEISIAGGIGIHVVLTNPGEIELTNVTVQLQVTGGLLKKINETETQTVNIPNGGTQTIKTKAFIGLGPLTVNVLVEGREKTAQGFQLLFLTFMKA